MNRLIALATADVPTVAGPLYMAAALILRIAAAHGLVLLTSTSTPTAEAAMITSFPVMMVGIFSVPGGAREALPEASRRILGLNPLALASDLFTHGWVGGTLERPSLELAALAAWAVVLCWAAWRYMRWETHR